MANLAHWVACVIYNERGEVLLLKRSADKKLYPELWSVVAGGLLPDDKDVKAAIGREVKEELNLIVDAQKVSEFEIEQVGTISFVSLFKAEISSGAIIVLNHEHTQYVWINPDSTEGYDLVPGVDLILAKSFSL